MAAEALGSIREAIRLNTELLRESLASRYSRHLKQSNLNDKGSYPATEPPR
jgi:hypothetical protein